MTAKEQLYYVREATDEMVGHALGLDGKAKTLLMQDADTRYNSTDLESATRRLYGELDELAKEIEKMEKIEKEREFTTNFDNLDKI